MKFQSDLFETAVTGYGPGWIRVGSERIEHNIVLSSVSERRAWSCADFDSLAAEHFKSLIADRPELVVFGSGNVLRFPRPAWIRPLIEAGIGVETMDTPAACRTYNILAGEDRRVVAALLLESGPAGAIRLK